MPDEPVTETRPLFYQPQLPARFATQEAVAKLAPNAMQRRILSAIASAEPIGQKVVELAAPVADDKTLSDEGRRLKREGILADTVTAGIAQHIPALTLAEMWVAEGSAGLLRAAIKAATVSEPREMGLSVWLRDLKPEDRQRAVFDAIRNADAETVAAAVNGPRGWNLIAGEALRDRAITMLVERHDAVKAEELRDFKTLIQCAREGFEALNRFARERLRLPPLPAQPARRTGTGAAADTAPTQA